MFSSHSFLRFEFGIWDEERSMIREGDEMVMPVELELESSWC